MSFGSIGPRETDRPKNSLDPRLLRFLEKLSSGQFFGKVVLSFQNGKAVDVRIEQTKKLEEL
jgi:hypothetical protein